MVLSIFYPVTRDGQDGKKIRKKAVRGPLFSLLTSIGRKREQK
jgi:hypothetical protein